MKKRVKLMVVLLLVNLIIFLPSIYAYMIRLSNTTNQIDFVVGDTTCVVNETFDNVTKSSVTIENKGNVDVYIRVKVLIYWADSKGAPIGAELYEDKNHPLPTLNCNLKDWLYDSVNGYYYCKEPIRVGEQTAELLQSNLVLSNYIDPINEGYSYIQVAEIIAESIQALPRDLNTNDSVITNPATESWGVTIDSEGIIIGAN